MIEDHPPYLRQDPPRFGPLIVGRAREQIYLREELAATLRGRGSFVVLGGEAGIGKTTLALDLAREAADQGASTLVGHCYDRSNRPPYGPWLELFRNQGTAPRPAPPIAFAGGRLERVTDQAALFGDVYRFFAEAAAIRPLLVLLEDMHWSDPTSIDLLRSIAPLLRHDRVMVLVTYRTDELRRTDPLYLQLPAFIREANALRLDLRRLGGEVMRALIAGRFALAPDDEHRLMTYLQRHAEGNPFYAHELLRALQEEELLTWANEGWELAELDRLVVPRYVRQVIDGRIARLGEQTRRLLEMAAVIGHEVPLELWAQMTGLAIDELVNAVEIAVGASLLEAERAGHAVRFVHALTRDALYDGILPPRRRMWHGAIAELLSANARADPDTVAHHFAEAGDPRAVEWLEHAGNRAQRGYAWLAASERFRHAAELLGHVEGQERNRGRLLFRRAILIRYAEPHDAIDALAEVGRLSTQTGDDVRAEEVRSILGHVLCYANQFRAGLEESERAYAALEAMPSESTTPLHVWLTEYIQLTQVDDSGDDAEALERLRLAGLHYRRCTHPWLLASAGHVAAALESGERFVHALPEDLLVKSRVRYVAAYAFHGLGIALAGLGRPDEAAEAWRRGRIAFHEIGHHAVLAFSLLDEARDVAATYQADEPARRRWLATEAEAALARAGGALRPGVSAKLALLGSLVLDGRWDEAVNILRDLPDPGSCFLQREVAAAICTLALARGEPELAWERIRATMPDGPATEPGNIIFQEGLCLFRVAAELLLAEGQIQAASDWLRAMDHWLEWSRCVLGRAEARLAWAIWHRAAGALDRAREEGLEAISLAQDPVQPLVLLRAHRLVGEIATQIGAFDAAETHLAEAMRLGERCDVPFEQAVTQIALAEWRWATGDATSASTLLEDAGRILTPLAAAPALGRMLALATQMSLPAARDQFPAGLTHREVDVLRLLTRQQTDKEIAMELFISPRTVSTHVANIFAKLGVSNRREAARTAARIGLD
jgi:DNA-binding CsgD family transcriptional regulator